MNDKEISTTKDGYPEQGRRPTVTSINLNKNMDAMCANFALLKKLNGTSYDRCGWPADQHHITAGSPILSPTFREMLS